MECHLIYQYHNQMESKRIISEASIPAALSILIGVKQRLSTNKKKKLEYQ
jgi:hypothetical protein